jgi:hypothetical protein
MYVHMCIDIYVYGIYMCIYIYSYIFWVVLPRNRAEGAKARACVIFCVLVLWCSQTQPHGFSKSFFVSLYTQVDLGHDPAVCVSLVTGITGK